MWKLHLEWLGQGDSGCIERRTGFLEYFPSGIYFFLNPIVGIPGLEIQTGCRLLLLAGFVLST